MITSALPVLAGRHRVAVTSAVLVAAAQAAHVREVARAAPLAGAARLVHVPGVADAGAVLRRHLCLAAHLRDQIASLLAVRRLLLLRRGLLLLTRAAAVLAAPRVSGGAVGVR